MIQMSIILLFRMIYTKEKVTKKLNSVLKNALLHNIKMAERESFLISCVCCFKREKIQEKKWNTRQSQQKIKRCFLELLLKMIKTMKYTILKKTKQ